MSTANIPLPALGINLWQALLGTAVGAWYTLFAHAVSGITTCDPLAGLQMDVWVYQVGFLFVTVFWLGALLSTLQRINTLLQRLMNAKTVPQFAQALIGTPNLWLPLLFIVALPIVAEAVLQDRTDVVLHWPDGVYGPILILFLVGGRFCEVIRQLSGNGAPPGGQGQALLARKRY
jgi:hypothetical protein